LPLVCAGCDEGSWDTVSDRLRRDGQKCRLWAVGCGGGTASRGGRARHEGTREMWGRIGQTGGTGQRVTGGGKRENDGKRGRLPFAARQQLGCAQNHRIGTKGTVGK